MMDWLSNPDNFWINLCIAFLVILAITEICEELYNSIKTNSRKRKGLPTRRRNSGEW